MRFGDSGIACAGAFLLSPAKCGTDAVHSDVRRSIFGASSKRRKNKA